MTNINKYVIIYIENKKWGIFMTQVATALVTSSGEANEMLRAFERNYPKRKIIGVSYSSAGPWGWFMTVTYIIEGM